MSEKKKKLLPEGMDREERTEFLNHAMRSVVPSICVERAGIITESYKRTEGMPLCHATRHRSEGYAGTDDYIY